MDKIQKLALFVPPVDNNFDPNSQPSSGEEYLQHVIYERRNCPVIVVADRVDLSWKPVESSSINPPSTHTNQKISKPSFYPTPEWEMHQGNEFNRIRQKVIDYRELYNSTYDSDNSIIIPNTTDNDQWFKFCSNNQPLLQTMLQIDQRTLEYLLESLLEWLNEESWSILFEKQEINLAGNEKWLSQWIYAGLACIKLPIEPDLHSVLREIAKICINLRNKLNVNDNVQVAPLNLFICIISNNFNQLDLGDNF